MDKKDFSSPDPKSKNLGSFLSSIEKHLVQIPLFQRDFVWPAKKTANLMDSILKGYPIGTFILWKTKEKFRLVKTSNLPEPPER